MLFDLRIVEGGDFIVIYFRSSEYMRKVIWYVGLLYLLKI